MTTTVSWHRSRSSYRKAFEDKLLKALIHSTVQQAQGHLKTWIFLVREQAITPFLPFLDTLERYWTSITNFFKRRLTSGFVEGLNNKIRVLTRRCFALFNLEHFSQRLWLDLEGYRAFA
jgi:transposase